MESIHNEEHAGRKFLTLPSILQNRNFLLLFMGAVVSASGSSISNLTIAWLVFNTTHSALTLTYLGLASIFPTIILGLIAGALVDRFDRRRLMIASDLIRAAAVMMIPVYLILKGFDLLPFLAAAIIVGTFSSIFRPATNALLPRLVSGALLQDANGLMSASISLAGTISQALGGLIIVLGGVILGVSYNSITYLVSALMILLIVIPKRSETTAQPRRFLLTEIREGLHYMRVNRGILEITFSSTVANFFFTMIVPFIVVYAGTALNADPGVYGFLLAGFSLGYAFGSVLVGRISAVRFAGKLFIATGIGFGLVPLGLVFFKNIPLAILLTSTMGIFLGLYNTTYFSIIQLKVPDKVLGRVLSIDEVGSFAAIPLGQISAGLLIVSSSITYTYLIAGLGLLATGLITIFLRDLRNLRSIPQ